MKIIFVLRQKKSSVAMVMVVMESITMVTVVMEKGYYGNSKKRQVTTLKNKMHKKF